jgi:hypothetical protein
MDVPWSLTDALALRRLDRARTPRVTTQPSLEPKNDNAHPCVKLTYNTDVSVPVSLNAILTIALMAHPRMAAKHIPQLIAFAKANPDCNYSDMQFAWQ